jgi:hypothetical protein
MKGDSAILHKSLIPNSILIWLGLYGLVMGWVIWNTENISSTVFYAIILGAFMYWCWTIRSKYDCRLLLSPYELFVEYYHPRIKNRSFELKKIKSNILIKRFFMGRMIGGFPRRPDLVNYK